MVLPYIQALTRGRHLVLADILAVLWHILFRHVPPTALDSEAATSGVLFKKVFLEISS